MDKRRGWLGVRVSHLAAGGRAQRQGEGQGWEFIFSNREKLLGYGVFLGKAPAGCGCPPDTRAYLACSVLLVKRKQVTTAVSEDERESRHSRQSVV